MKKYLKAIFSLLLWLVMTSQVQAIEMIIGESTVPPGIRFIFEGGVKDEITPSQQHLSEGYTDVHLEVLANWIDTGKRPQGAPANGFIPYLNITAMVRNEKTGKATLVQLVPHVNANDNFHYARNLSLPGDRKDPYEVTFHIHPPGPFELAFHKDWAQAHGTQLFEPQQFSFSGLDFSHIAGASRR